MQLPSFSHHEVLLLWSQLLVIVAAALIAGNIARRLHQPTVVGEILVGVVLGPSVFGKLWPGGAGWLIPGQPLAAAPLNALGWIGAALLLVLTGFDTDLRVVRRLKRSVCSVSVGALAFPAAVGALIATVLPAQFLGTNRHRLSFILFIAISLSISSLPVIAKILHELDYMRRNFAQVILGVGMLNDLIGWLALGFLATLSRSGSIPPAKVAIAIAEVAAVVVIAFVPGQRIVDSSLRRARRIDHGKISALGITLIATFLLAVATQAVGSDAVLGAYIAGIVLGRSSSQDPQVRGQLEALTMAVFAPLFFATAGLRMDILILRKPAVLVGTCIVLSTAIGTKLIGAYCGARFAGMAPRDAIAVGIGLNTRGAVEIVIASVGLSLGVLSDSGYTAIALMAIVTSVMTPPLLKKVVRSWPGTAEEQARLDCEQSLQQNVLVRPGPLLLPIDGGQEGSYLVAAGLLHGAWPVDAGVTVVHEGGAAAAAQGIGDGKLSQLLIGRRITYRRLGKEQANEAILDESMLGYSAIGMTLEFLKTGPDASTCLLSPVAATLLSQGNVPLVAVRCSAAHPGPPFRRAVVPVTGTIASRAALELALSFARATGAEILLVHVIHPGNGRHRDEAISALEDATATAAKLQVPVESIVQDGASLAQGILNGAVSGKADLIVLGARTRHTQQSQYFSPTIGHVLAEAKATVAVVCIPDRYGRNS